MPKLPIEILPLIIDLPDYNLENITFKRKAEIIEQVWDLRGSQVRLVYDVIPFAANGDGSYGDRLDQAENSSFTTKRVQISAQNKYYVNAQTGKILCEVSENANSILENVYYMADYDFYYMLATTKQIVLLQLISQAILSNY